MQRDSKLLTHIKEVEWKVEYEDEAQNESKDGLNNLFHTSLVITIWKVA
jgi:hypothetical protein